MSASMDAREGTDWTQATLTELCDHIEQTHHRYLVEELPLLSSLVEKVSKVHGERHPDLHHVNEVFTWMSQDLLMHLKKEEQILFPLIRALESGGSAAGPGSVAAPIRRMEAEHAASNKDMETLRRLTDGFTPPEDACGSYRAMLTGLERLEKDLEEHIHKENDILFPRAIALEESR